MGKTERLIFQKSHIKIALLNKKKYKYFGNFHQNNHFNVMYLENDQNMMEK